MKAICFNCGPTTTTFKIKDVPFSETEGYASILVGICDKCEMVITIPAQSVSIIKTKREEILGIK